MQISYWMETDSIAACRQNINILGTKIVNNVPGVFRDVKKFCKNCEKISVKSLTGIGGFNNKYIV